MKQFKIVDCVSNRDTIVITSNNGKNALKLIPSQRNSSNLIGNTLMLLRAAMCWAWASPKCWTRLKPRQHDSITRLGESK